MKPKLIHNLERAEPLELGPHAESPPRQVFTCPFCGADRAPHAPHCGVAIPPLLPDRPERLDRPRRRRRNASRRALTLLFLAIFGLQFVVLLAAGQWWAIGGIALVTAGIVHVVGRGRSARPSRPAPVHPRTPRRPVNEVLADMPIAVGTDPA